MSDLNENPLIGSTINGYRVVRRAPRSERNRRAQVILACEACGDERRVRRDVVKRSVIYPCRCQRGEPVSVERSKLREPRPAADDGRHLHPRFRHRTPSDPFTTTGDEARRARERAAAGWRG